MVAAFGVTAIRAIMYFSAGYSNLSGSWLRRNATIGVIALLGFVALAAKSSESADFVIHISVDGLNPTHLQTQINAGLAPNFKRFQEEGAWTNNARTDYTHTITLPNHTSMLTGRPVSLPTGMPAQTHHGYTDNGNPPPTWTVHNFMAADWYKASTFDVVHAAGFSTAMYASKNKFIIYDQSYNATPGPTHPDDDDEISSYYGPESSMMMQSQMLSDLGTNNFKYTFVHYADPDDNGHATGWGNPAYMASLVTVDNYLGQLFNLIQTDPELAGRTAIVLSADHGGVTGTTGHSSASNPSNYTIPFYVWGAGVAHGDLYAFNSAMDTSPATRTNPATGRPDYNASGQPIRNGDGGNLALSLLGLNAIPGSLVNVAQNLRVALPGDFNADNVVDSADYVVWRKGLNTPNTPGQYDAWAANFGATYPGGSVSITELGPPVPEPSAVVLVLAAVILPASNNRRRACVAAASC